jgi:hypothetical protein
MTASYGSRGRQLEDYPLGTCAAETWLLRIGWLRAGPPISMYAIPGRDCYEGSKA